MIGHPQMLQRQLLAIHQVGVQARRVVAAQSAVDVLKHSGGDVNRMHRRLGVVLQQELAHVTCATANIQTGFGLKIRGQKLVEPIPQKPRGFPLHPRMIIVLPGRTRKTSGVGQCGRKVQAGEFGTCHLGVVASGVKSEGRIVAWGTLGCINELRHSIASSNAKATTGV